MLTKFGKYCRKLRIERNEILKDMSEKLGVTVSYLSAVENGNRSIPADWQDKLSKIYALNDLEVHELKIAIIDTNEEIRLKLKKGDVNRQEFALKLARKFDTLTQDEIEKISKILQED